MADALLLRASDGVRNGALVVDIGRTTNGAGFGTLAYPAFAHLRDNSRTLASVAATTLDPSPLALGDESGTMRVFGRTVSASYFDVVGARPVAGRFFLADEDVVPGASPVAVLTHDFWQRHFQGDAAAVGRIVRLNNTPFTIIGVAEPGFVGTSIVGTDLWIPVTMAGVARGESAAALFAEPEHTWHIAVGRLAQGVTVDAARAELNTLLAGYRASTPAVPDTHGVRVEPGGRLPPTARASFTRFLGLLLALAGGLLAIACSNVAGMLLVRATARHREMATRLALGASPARLVRFTLVETLLLFSAAAAVALPLTYVLMRAFEAALPTLPVPVVLDLTISPATLGFTIGISLLTGIVFGLAPARHAVRGDLSPQLYGRSSTDTRSRLRLRHGLLVTQVALSTLLVFTAGLFTRALQEAGRLDLGFETHGIDIVTLDTTPTGLDPARALSSVDTAVARVRAIAGVESVGYARMVPLFSGGFAIGSVRVPDGADESAVRNTQWDVVSDDYFRTIAMPLAQGRAFTRDDGADRPLVAVVNETFARRAWPGRSAIGQHFFLVQDNRERTIEVVGVSRDAQYQVIGEPARPFVYVPFAQHPQGHVELFVRHVNDRNVVHDVRAAIAQAAPAVPIVFVQRFEDAVAGGTFPQRLAAWTAGLVGAVGTFLAGLGLYGLVAFVLSLRHREIAIRLALGAQPRQMSWLVLRRALRLSILGASVGLLMAVALGRILATGQLLLGVIATDTITIASVAVLMGAMIGGACWFPARRAARTDATLALRAE